jgi:hypothetical protein
VTQVSPLDRVRRLVGDARTAMVMPRVDIVLSRGEPAEDTILREYRRRHPRYKVVGRKTVGVALLPLDEFDGVDGYLAGVRYARRRVKRASRLGYTASLFDPNDRRSDLLAIHTSIPERQGRPIEASYLDPDANYEPCPHVEYAGVFRDDVLVAYSELEYAGDVVGTSRIMGHGEYLADGIMFLLVASIVEHVKRSRPDVRYVCYDMFFGASNGLRAFKSHAGFRPHHVRWRRDPRPPAALRGPDSDR